MGTCYKAQRCFQWTSWTNWAHAVLLAGLLCQLFQPGDHHGDHDDNGDTEYDTVVGTWTTWLWLIMYQCVPGYLVHVRSWLAKLRHWLHLAILSRCVALRPWSIIILYHYCSLLSCLITKSVALDRLLSLCKAPTWICLYSLIRAVR